MLHISIMLYAIHIVNSMEMCYRSYIYILCYMLFILHMNCMETCCRKYVIFENWLYVTVITWPRGICLIYMPKPEGRRPEGAGIYIRQITSGRVISNICHITLHVQWSAADAISAIYFIERHMRFECGCEIFVTSVMINKCEIVRESLTKVDSSAMILVYPWKI